MLPPGTGRSLRKKLLNRFWKPVVSAYLEAPRKFQFKGLRLLVTPGVFHPGFFFSSKILANFILQQDLNGKKVLDLGCGSGLVALCAASRGAASTATDISEKAIVCTVQNAAGNQLQVEVLHSDLFDALSGRHFDVIAVNPPYYKKEARSTEEMAWYAGTDYGYFQKFFAQLKNVIHGESTVCMILSVDCDLSAIFSEARSGGFRLQPVSVHRRLAEKLTLYEIVPV